MSASQPLGRPRFREALCGVAAQRLEHPEARVARCPGDDQGLVDEAGQQLKHLVVCSRGLVPAHLLGRLQREAPANTDSRPKSSRSGPDNSSWLQSIAARSVWWRGSAVAAPRGEQSEAIVEARGDLAWGEDPDPGRRQFERQRHAVEAAADAAHGGSSAGVEHERWAGRRWHGRRRVAPRPIVPPARLTAPVVPARPAGAPAIELPRPRPGVPCWSRGTAHWAPTGAPARRPARRPRSGARSCRAPAAVPSRSGNR